MSVRLKTKGGSMNNLLRLRKELNLTQKELSKYCGVSPTVIVYLENGKRMFRQAHIDSLTSFFNVTADYLLGKSDKGYIVFSEDDGRPLTLSENEYLSVKDNIEITIIEGDGFGATIHENDKEWNIYIPKYFVHRELKGSILDYSLDSSLLEKANSLIKDMNNEQLKKLIRFIEDYLL